MNGVLLWLCNIHEIQTLNIPQFWEGYVLQKGMPSYLPTHSSLTNRNLCSQYVTKINDIKSIVSSFLLFKQLSFIKFHFTYMGNKWQKSPEEERNRTKWTEGADYLHACHASAWGEMDPLQTVPTPAPFDTRLNIIRNVVSMSFHFTPWGWKSSQISLWEQWGFKLQTRRKIRKNKSSACPAYGQCLWWLWRELPRDDPCLDLCLNPCLWEGVSSHGLK